MLTDTAPPAAGPGERPPGLRDAPLLFLFYETSCLPRQREFLEQGLGLPVVENQFHPPHHSHGLVKYDAGPILLSLNLSPPRRFPREGSDALVAVFVTGRTPAVAERLRTLGGRPSANDCGLFTDPDGHHYVLRPAGDGAGATPALRELRLAVDDLALSLAFYREALGLESVEEVGQTARLRAGRIDLVLEQGARSADGRRPHHDTYLPVFYTADVHAAYAALVRRGLRFNPARVGFSEIGGTARFTDPSGHRFCLYEPSPESLAWGSGPKVLEIIDSPAAASAAQRTPSDRSQPCLPR